MKHLVGAFAICAFAAGCTEVNTGHKSECWTAAPTADGNYVVSQSSFSPDAIGFMSNEGNADDCVFKAF